MIFVDQPLGVGFSQGPETTDMEVVADQMLEFIIKFQSKYPEMKRTLYLTGESFAGKYIPAMVNAIIEHNKKTTLSGTIKIGGLMIGDPLVDTTL